MANNWKVKINSAGARAVLNSGGVQSAINNEGSRIAARAQSFGGSYSFDVQPGINRAHCIVRTDDFAARKANAQFNALLKSL